MYPQFLLTKDYDNKCTDCQLSKELDRRPILADIFHRSSMFGLFPHQPVKITRQKCQQTGLPANGGRIRR
jgi:hypothetical protein